MHSIHVCIENAFYTCMPRSVISRLLSVQCTVYTIRDLGLHVCECLNKNFVYTGIWEHKVISRVSYLCIFYSGTYRNPRYSLCPINKAETSATNDLVLTYLVTQKDAIDYL